MKQWFIRTFSCLPPRKDQLETSSTSRHSDAPNAQSTPTTTTNNVPLTSVSPLPVSPVQPPTVPRPKGMDHNSPLINGTLGNPASYTMGGASSQAPIQAPTLMGASIQARDSLPSGGAAGISPKADVTASRTASSKLPSQVEETLAACPRFRILLVGNTGVGKTSLFRHVFNIVFNVSLPNGEDGTTIDVAHDRVGKADIDNGYYSDQNPRFILHDSMGFEPGYVEKAEIVKSFLRDRAECSAKLPDQVHAIWLCIETPRKGSRLLQTGDENLLKLAEELKIPLIVVLTKYDLLVMEHHRACSQHLPLADKKVEAARRARQAFIEVTKELKVPFVPVSTKIDALKEYGEAMLVDLTQVTQDNLLDVKGSLRALWATAQQINARQKFELSISEGLKRYWRDLGDSGSFQGYRLVDCIARIHDDVLKIWNFNDPAKVLSGEEFFKGMMDVLEPLSHDIIRKHRIDDTPSNVVSIAGEDDTSLVLPALGTIIEMAESQFLRNKYQKGVSTAIYLGSYIVDLTLVLYSISTVVMTKPPMSLSLESVMKALAKYKSRSPLIHAQVKEVAFTRKLEEKIVNVIRGEVGSTTRSI